MPRVKASKKAPADEAVNENATKKPQRGKKVENVEEPKKSQPVETKEKVNKNTDKNMAVVKKSVKRRGQNSTEEPPKGQAKELKEDLANNEVATVKQRKNAKKALLSEEIKEPASLKTVDNAKAVVGRGRKQKDAPTLVDVASTSSKKPTLSRKKNDISAEVDMSYASQTAKVNVPSNKTVESKTAAKRTRAKKLNDHALVEQEEGGSPKKKLKLTDKNRKKKDHGIDENGIDEKAETKTSAKATPTLKRGTNRKRTAQSDNIDHQKEVMTEEADNSKPTKAKKPLLNPTETVYNKADFELSISFTMDGNNSNVSNGSPEYQRKLLKISSWNVAGLRSWLKKDGLKFLDYEEPDIFCIQEIKCTVDQLPEEAVRIQGYHPYWLSKPGGQAGVALYSKIMPINVEYGINDAEFDSAGRLITAEYEKFYLINVYVPNSGRKLVNLEPRMRWEKLFQAHVKKLDTFKPVVICGDMNVSHLEIDLANPKSNTRSAGFTKEERNKMTELQALGYVDTFRHLHPDQRGAYTYWTYMSNARARNVGWRLDYFLVSERITKRVVENVIRSQCMGSDHCPITLFLKI